MANKNLNVVAQLRARPGKEKVVKEELLKLLAPTRAEKGCLQYDLHQSAEDPALFLFYEEWTSAEALQLHFETPHLKHLQSVAEEILAEPTSITRWLRVGQ